MKFTPLLRPVLVRFVPDIHGQYLMFLRRQDDSREGNWTVQDRYRIQAKTFARPYSPQLATVKEAYKEGLGRVFHFEGFHELFGNEKLRGQWRVWLGRNGLGSWTNLQVSAPEIARSPWDKEQQFVFHLPVLPPDWHKQSALNWSGALENELQKSASDARFALEFASLSHKEQENIRLHLKRGTVHQLRNVLTWLVQTHEPFW